MTAPAPVETGPPPRRDPAGGDDTARVIPPDAWRTAKRLAAVGGVVALVLLALVGFLTVTRGTPMEWVRTDDGAMAIPAIDDPLFARTMELYTGTPLQGGTALEVLSNGDGTYPRLWADLRAATRSINVQLYFSKRGAVADTMAAVLAERARAGVRVRLLLDAFGSQPLKGAWADSLSAAGVDVRFLRRMRWYKLDRVTSRSHVRAIVVDARVAYGGGFGLADYWLGGGRVDGEWREENVRFEGPAVAQAQAAFGVAWTEATGELLTGELLFPEQPLASPGVRAAFMLTSPTKGSTPAERFLALSIAGARRTLYIGNSYFLPDDDFRRLLREAVARGVDVRVLTASTKTDIMSVYFASRWRYEELLRAGVRIYEYQPTMIHSKTLVADGLWSAVGSMNFDNRSLALNDEANLVALDREVGATMDSLFLADLAYAREITLADFRRRPWWHRPLEGGAALLSRVL